nr:HU family DNA-binding protein [Niabella ginsengisoli]
MRKADLVNKISDKTGIPKVDVLVTLETMFKEVKDTLASGENIYIRGFGSFITKKELQRLVAILRKMLRFIFRNIIFRLLNPRRSLVLK